MVGLNEQKNMKKNNLYQTLKFTLVGIFSGLIGYLFVQSLSWCYEEYQDFKSPIEPGREMLLTIELGNPFEKTDTLWIKILEVKGGYVRYEQRIGGWKDTTSSRIGYLRSFTPVKRSR